VPRRDGVAVAAGTAPARAVARPLRAGELGQMLDDGGGGGFGGGLRAKVAAQHERELVLANELDEPHDDGMAQQPMRRHLPAAEPAEPRHLGLGRPRGLPEGGEPLARRGAPPQLLETHARDPGEQRRLRPHALLARLRPPGLIFATRAATIAGSSTGPAAMPAPVPCRPPGRAGDPDPGKIVAPGRGEPLALLARTPGRPPSERHSQRWTI
jgi:hypothetical protein